MRFEAVRFEGHPYKAIVIGPYSEAIYFTTAKWHGPFDSNGVPPTVDYAQVEIQGNCHGISFTAARLANWNNTHIRAINAAGVVVTSSSRQSGTL